MNRAQITHMEWALLSVWDKTGIVDLAKILQKHNVKILSSGGTAAVLRQAGIEVQDVSDYTQFPELMEGRVKTLHPKIHGGLLRRRGIDDAVMAAHQIRGIDLLVVNLYPFEQMLEQALSYEDMLEFIDVGGPAMIRAAAKNHRNVAVIVDPVDYPLVEKALESGDFTSNERFVLAKKAFARTAAYDGAISNYLHGLETDFPSTLFMQFTKGRPLRYGENPHQKGVVYGEHGVAGQEPLQGKQMSYNNYLDVNAAVALLSEFEDCCTVIVKHNNPCGVSVGSSPLQSYITARDVDPISAYGSVVACNREVESDLAREICRTFVEVIVAPSFTKDARHEMEKKEHMRVLELPETTLSDEFRSIDGGVLLQRTVPFDEVWRVVTKRSPTQRECAAMKLGWKVCKHTRSNAIIIASHTRTLGIGAGQMSRVDAAKIAILKACAPLKGAAVASDAFIPFPDTLMEVGKAGATSVIQPGGSIRDGEVIQAADDLDIAMVFTGIRYFKH